MEVRTRFAPSPTGFLHIGGLRTALYSYAFAKNQGGKFILRIEDTDQRRLIPGATETIYDTLKLFGLNWDEGPLVDGPYEPYIQSERVAAGIYQKYAERLVEKGNAYYCFCLPESRQEIEARHAKKEVKLRDPCRDLSPPEAKTRAETVMKPAIRLRVSDNEEISYYDFVLKKEIFWKTENVDEVMLLKSNGYPTYHLAVVVDDALMRVSHIIRGRDWLPSTPVHLLLFKYLNFSLPEIGHLTDILDPAGGKLSKRKGSATCGELLEDGYLPEAILNFIMLLGWAPKDNREIFSLDDFVKEFANGNLHVANPVFDRKKLDWLNGFYIRKKPNQELLQLIKPMVPPSMDDSFIAKTIPLVKERIMKLSQYADLVRFLLEEPEIEAGLLVDSGGGEKGLVMDQISKTKERLSALGQWRAEDLERLFRELAGQYNWHVGRFFMAVRVAITGKTITPPLFESMVLLGKDRSIERLNQSLKLLS